MAQHYPIGKGGFGIVFKHVIKKLHITRLNDFQRDFHEKANCMIQKLPVSEYKMNDNDKYIVSCYSLEDHTFSYEVHLDKDFNVIEVYQVM
jgi:hypothetical protein